MVTVTFTANLQRHIAAGPGRVEAGTVREILQQVFTSQPGLRTYLIDDQGALRHHMAIFVNGEPIRDRRSLSDPVADHADVHILQALSGG